jgi:hypothetical protein
MRKAAVAEWVLSRSRGSIRASAITGDLLEQAESRGPIWFWFSVIRTVLSGPVCFGLGLWMLCRTVQLVVMPVIFWRLLNPAGQWFAEIRSSPIQENCASRLVNRAATNLERACETSGDLGRRIERYIRQYWFQTKNCLIY